MQTISVSVRNGLISPNLELTRGIGLPLKLSTDGMIPTLSLLAMQHMFSLLSVAKELQQE